MPHRFPLLRADVSGRPEPDGRFLVEQGQLQLRLGPFELQLISQLDGRTPPTELEHDLALASGRPVRPGTVLRLVARLAQLGLVELPAAPPLRWLPDDRVGCRASGDCCHLAVGPLEPFEVARLRALPWAAAGEAAPAGAGLVSEAALQRGEGAGRGEGTGEGAEDGGTAEDGLFLGRQEDGACAFLEQDGRCRIHRVFGPHAKPAICRVFPLFCVDLGHEVRVGSAIHCPGVCQAGGGQTVEQEAAQLGELLLQTNLEVGPLRLVGDEGAAEAAGEAAGEAAPVAPELEEELLELLRKGGGSADAALAAALRRVLAVAGPRAGEGIGLEPFEALLLRHFEQQGRALSHPADRRWVMATAALLRRTALDGPQAGGGVLPLDGAADALVRRHLRVLLFTRSHLFQHGLVAGMAVLASLHLHARLAAAAAAGDGGCGCVGLEPTGASLRTAFFAVQGLAGAGELFRGAGRRVLEQLVARLEARGPEEASGAILTGG